MKRLDLHILYEILQFLLYSTLALQDEGKTHKHQQLWGIVNGLGGWQTCVYVFLGFFHFGGERAHKQNLQRNLGQSLEKYCLRFFFLRQTPFVFG